MTPSLSVRIKRGEIINGVNKLTKRCSICGENKLISEFHIKKTGKFGIGCICKPCSKELHAKWYLKNTERVYIAVRKWQSSHSELKKQTQKEWNKNNSEKFRMYSSEWKKRNPEKYLIYKRNREVRIINAPGNGWSVQEEKQLKKDYLFRCAYCGKISKLTMDHVISINQGGEHSINNIVPACKSCNCSKKDTPLLVWLYQRRQQNG